VVPDPSDSSTGLPSRTAAVLAYSGWWVTGLIFWLLERRDGYVRFHAAQAVAGFGLLATAMFSFGSLGVLSLSMLPAAFPLFMAAAGLTWVAGVVLWGWSMWRAALGHRWRVPIVADLADRLVAGQA
jgi:uncharacterized membrane protein